jgi:hypothetical protein
MSQDPAAASQAASFDARLRLAAMWRRRPIVNRPCPTGAPLVI